MVTLWNTGNAFDVNIAMLRITHHASNRRLPDKQRPLHTRQDTLAATRN